MIKTALKISGMACSMCEAHINDAVRSAFSVKKVQSSHKKGETVIISREPLDRARLLEAIRATGYTVTSVTEETTRESSLMDRLFRRDS